jgi:hypothetical protein
VVAGSSRLTLWVTTFVLVPLIHIRVSKRHCQTHDWVVDQIDDLFHTTHTVKTEHVTKNRGRHCGDIEVTDYLPNVVDPVPVVLDLHISHDRFGSTSDLNLNRHLHYPNDIDKSLNETVTDKIRKYRSDYNNNPPVVVPFMSDIVSTSGRLHSEFVRLLFLQTHRETDRFFTTSGVQLVQTNCGLFHFHRVEFSSQLISRVDLSLVKTTVLRITLNLDGSPITSKSHTHPSHSQTSRLLTSSLSLGVPVPRSTPSVIPWYTYSSTLNSPHNRTCRTYIFFF